MVLFSLVASVVLMVLVLVNLLLRWHLLSWFAFSAAARPDARLFTRQQRIVHGVLARAVLAAHVSQAVQPVRSSRAE